MMAGPLPPKTGLENNGTSMMAAEETVMGLYRERVLPRIINVACGTKTAEPLRRRVCEGLAGDVVEIGFGSGLNVPFYPAAVTRVAAVDPAEVGWKLPASASGQQLSRCSGLAWTASPSPSPTTGYDAALSTWTLCTVPDPPPPCANCGASSSPEAPCASSSTDWPPTNGYAAGSDASSR
jgi:hypothetical protein